MKEWRRLELGDLLEVKHGFAFLGEYFSGCGTHIVVTPGNFYDEGGFKHKPDKEKWYRGPVPCEYVLKEGDLIVAMTEQAEGLLGSSALVPASNLYLHNQRIGLVQLRDEKQTEKKFVYYLFNSQPVRQQIRGSASGTKIRHTAPSRIAAVKVDLPPAPIQRRIAGILSAYDDLIENSQRRIKILEEMARRLYREWFVHFRFPGHEECRFMESPLGEIPEGWAAVKIGAVADVLRGRSYRSADLCEEGGLPFLNLKCLDRDGGFRRSGLKCYSGDYKQSQIARKGDIVMAVTDMTQERRIVARVALVPTLDNEYGVISMDLVRVEPRLNMPKAFLYSFLRYSSFPDEVKHHANGANVLHLSPDRVTDYEFAQPDVELMNRYSKLAESIFEEIDTLDNRLANLRRTRDLLLPRLLSGQIDVEALGDA